MMSSDDDVLTASVVMSVSDAGESGGSSSTSGGLQPSGLSRVLLDPEESRERRRTSISAEAMDPEAAMEQLEVGPPKSAEEIARISAACKSNLLFRFLSEEQLQLAYSAMERMEVPSGYTIITQGDEGDYFYVVDEGEFAVFVDGVQVVVIEAGGSFGELALMYTAPRAATVTALSDSVVYALDRVAFNITLMNAVVKKRNSGPLASAFMAFDWLLTSGVDMGQLRDACAAEDVREGSVIIAAGDVGADKFYFLLEGEVELRKTDGSTPLVLHAPDCFNEIPLIDFTVPAYDFVARSNCVLKSIDRVNFIRLLMRPCADQFAAFRSRYP